jgi:hypothetical protein
MYNTLGYRKYRVGTIVDYEVPYHDALGAHIRTAYHSAAVVGIYEPGECTHIDIPTLTLTMIELHVKGSSTENPSIVITYNPDEFESLPDETLDYLSQVLLDESIEYYGLGCGKDNHIDGYNEHFVQNGVSL